ncbi:MAG: hypothetical protein AAGA65_02555 [Actinomycetota bacterium]
MSSTNTLADRPEDNKPGKTPPPKVPAPEVWESRAVIKLIEAGSAAECPHCGERVKFRARHRDQQVICNVYENGVWKRVEQYHLDCYLDAGSPHGDAAKP